MMSYSMWTMVKSMMLISLIRNSFIYKYYFYYEKFII